jgi:hypothetical protein
MAEHRGPSAYCGMKNRQIAYCTKEQKNQQWNCSRFEVPTALKVLIVVFWVARQCNLLIVTSGTLPWHQNQEDHKRQQWLW